MLKGADVKVRKGADPPGTIAVSVDPPKDSGKIAAIDEGVVAIKHRARGISNQEQRLHEVSEHRSAVYDLTVEAKLASARRLKGRRCYPDAAQ